MQPPDRIREKAGQVLQATAQEILETMFFAIADPAAPVEDWGGPALSAEVTFHGDWHGRFDLRIRQHCAGTMTENFSGAAGEATDEQTAQMLCELANMFCGATLSRLAPDGRFDLDSPRLMCQLPGAAAESGAGREEAVEWLDAGDCPLRLHLEWEVSR